MSDPKIYTAKDIERYLRGEMTAAEMHLLEKAALDDSMLADAIEGYSFTTTASTDLEKLQHKLQQRVKEQPNKRAVVFRSLWLRIAALVLLAAGGGLVVFQTFSNKNHGLAMSSEGRNEVAPVQATDSLSTAFKIPAPVLHADSTVRSQDVETGEPIANKNQKKRFSPVPIGKKSIDHRKEEAGAIASTKAKERKEFVPYATASHTESVTAAAPRTFRDSNREQAISSKEDNAQLNEVVVTGANAKYQRRTASFIEPAEPAEGWEAFARYIAKNRKAPEKMKKNTGAEVELSFNVDEKGRPIDVNVTKPLCGECNEEAIRLLKEGPRWKGKKGTVKILLYP